MCVGGSLEDNYPFVSPPPLYQNMQDGDCERLEHLLQVQHQQMTSLKDTVKSKEAQFKELRDEHQDLQKKFEQLQAFLQQSVKEGDEFRGKESGLQLELHEKLNRQGASLLGLANKHLEGRERELDLLSFEVEKKDRVIASLRDEIRKREESLFALRSDYEDLMTWKQKVQDGKVAAVLQHRANADARVALTTAELFKQATEKETLHHKFKQNEERMLEKDMEIRSLRERLHMQEETAGQQQRTLSSLQFELNLKDVQLADMHKTALNREGELSVQLRREKEGHEEQSNIQLDRHNQQLEDRTAEIERLRRCIEEFENRAEHQQAKFAKREEEFDHQARRMAELQRLLLEAEARMEATDRSAEINLFRDGERELKRRLSEQAGVIEALQHDAVILEKTRVENALKDRQNLELKCQLDRLAVRLTQSEQEVGPPGSMRRKSLLDVNSSPYYPHAAFDPLSSNPSGSHAVHSAVALTLPLAPRSTTASVNSAGDLPRVPCSAAADAPPSWLPPYGEEPDSLGGYGYLPVMSDAVDVAVSSFLNCNRAANIQPLSIRRIECGLYMIGDKQVVLKLMNGQLMVEVPGGVMHIADYMASERYSMNLPVATKQFSRISQRNGDLRRGLMPSPFPKRYDSANATKAEPAKVIDPFSMAVPVGLQEPLYPSK